MPEWGTQGLRWWGHCRLQDECRALCDWEVYGGAGWGGVHAPRCWIAGGAADIGHAGMVLPFGVRMAGSALEPVVLRSHPPAILGHPRSFALCVRRQATCAYGGTSGVYRLPLVG